MTAPGRRSPSPTRSLTLSIVGRARVLIVSNGHGEDAVGAALAGRLEPPAAVTAYPLVGTGRVYSRVRLIDPRADFPSGGFGARGRGWLTDLRVGALRQWSRQRRAIRDQRGRADLTIAVGDVYCLWMASAARAPVVLVATAKSARHDPYSRPEIRILQSLAERVYARDEETAAALRAHGVEAAYMGNPLMDTVGTPSSPSRRSVDSHVVALLPGSRTDAYGNLRELLRLVDAVHPRAPVRWVCALAPTLDHRTLAASPVKESWSAAETALTRGDVRVELTGDFAGAVRDADVVVGLAGTANEQAAGLGKPVVAFPGEGPQFTARFLAAQQRLLGDALVATSGWMQGATAVLRLLGDPEERLRRGAAGRLRMGPAGAIERIAAEILAALPGQPVTRDS